MTFVIPNHVQPGDLIRAEDWNTVVDDMAALDARLRILESMIPGADGRIAITDLPSEVHVHDVLVIGGLNFGVPGENNVTFDGDNRVTDFLSANDRMLALRVPPISVPISGKTVNLTVTNATRGSASHPIRILRVVETVPSGQFTAVGPAQFKQGVNVNSPGLYVISIPLEIAALTMDESFTLTPTGPPNWEMTMVTAADGGVPLVPAQVPVAKTPDGQLFSRATVFLQFKIPGGITGTPPANVGLRVQAMHNPAMLRDASFPFTVNSPPPGTSSITFDVISVFPRATTIGQPPEQLVSFPLPTAVLNSGGSLSSLTLQTNAIPAGDYTVELVPPPSGTQWQVSLNNDPASWPQKNDGFKRTDSGVQDIGVFFIAPSGAAPTSFDIIVSGPGTANNGRRTQTIKGL